MNAGGISEQYNDELMNISGAKSGHRSVRQLGAKKHFLGS
jgi:hypothetical protein